MLVLMDGFPKLLHAKTKLSWFLSIKLCFCNHRPTLSGLRNFSDLQLCWFCFADFKERLLDIVKTCPTCHLQSQFSFWVQNLASVANVTSWLGTTSNGNLFWAHHLVPTKKDFCGEKIGYPNQARSPNRATSDFWLGIKKSVHQAKYCVLKWTAQSFVLCEILCWFQFWEIWRLTWISFLQGCKKFVIWHVNFCCFVLRK